VFAVRGDRMQWLLLGMVRLLASAVEDDGDQDVSLPDSRACVFSLSSHQTIRPGAEGCTFVYCTVGSFGLRA
jgi:hypothetical protein